MFLSLSLSGYCLLSGRTQSTKLQFGISILAHINRSIVQGSGVGPFLFNLFMSDLKALDLLNYLLKYADDVTLFNPENASTTAELEMDHIFNWASSNKMTVNLIKTKEMVFHRPNPRSLILPACLNNIDRVHEIKLLGVSFNSRLDFRAHVSAIVNRCNQRLYLISQLVKQGLGIAERNRIFEALVVNCITYALPAYYGFLTESCKLKIDSVFRKAFRWKLTDRLYKLTDLSDSLQLKLFRQSACSSHCLHHLFTRDRQGSLGVGLRRRGHNFYLPRIQYESNKRGFIIASLYKYK